MAPRQNPWVDIATVVPVVIPAKAGIHCTAMVRTGQADLDARVRGHDGNAYRNYHLSLEAKSPFLYGLLATGVLRGPADSVEEAKLLKVHAYLTQAILKNYLDYPSYNCSI